MHKPSAPNRFVLLGFALVATTFVVMAGTASASPAWEGPVDARAEDDPGSPLDRIHEARLSDTDLLDPLNEPDEASRDESNHVDGCVPHPSIEITERHGLRGFTWTNPVTGEREYRPTSGVVDGAGTEEDPYVIQEWCIPPNPKEAGITIEGTSAHVIIRDNLIEGGLNSLPVLGHDFGIELESAEHVTIEDNVIRNNRYYGVQLYEVSDVSIENNTFTNQGYNGVRAAWASDLLIANNSLTRNILDSPLNGGTGVRISSSTGVTVTHNNLGGHGPVGLLSWSEETHDVRNNWWGAPSGPSGGVEDACTGEIADGEGREIRTEHPAKHGTDGSVCFDPWLPEPVETAGAS